MTRNPPRCRRAPPTAHWARSALRLDYEDTARRSARDQLTESVLVDVPEASGTVAKPCSR